MRKLLQPLVWILAPVLGVAIFVAAQTGLQMVRPPGLEVRIGPRTTADYSSWSPNSFPPIDPNLSTIAANDRDATPIVITPPNVVPAVIVLPTTNKDELSKRLATSTLVPVRPSATPSPVVIPSNTPQPPPPTQTPQPTQTSHPTQTPPPPTQTPQPLQPSPTLTFTPQPINKTTIEFEPSNTPTNEPQVEATSKPGNDSPRKNPTKPPKKTPPGKGNGNGNGKGK